MPESESEFKFQLVSRALEALFPLRSLRDVSVQGSGSRWPTPWPPPRSFAHPYLRLRT
jgi:hypothetical protein